MKKITVEHMFEATVADDNTIIIMSTLGHKVTLMPDFKIFVENYDGSDMSNWMSFEDFVVAMTTDSVLNGDAEKAYFGWLEAFYVLQDINFTPVVELDRLLWDKTYEYFGASTQKEKDLTVGGWHVFTDGKEVAVIWSSEGLCYEIVPLTGKTIIYLDAEFAVIKL